jgi:hypothetical protein
LSLCLRSCLPLDMTHHPDCSRDERQLYPCHADCSDQRLALYPYPTPANISLGNDQDTGWSPLAYSLYGIDHERSQCNNTSYHVYVQPQLIRHPTHPFRLARILS